MKFEEFKQLFTSALEDATVNAEEELGRSIPRKYEVILHCPGYPGKTVDVDVAVSNLFVSEDKFYRIIDVAVLQVSPDVSRVYMRVSGHAPVPFQDTWNIPKGNGPFKQIIALIQEVES